VSHDHHDHHDHDHPHPETTPALDRAVGVGKTLLLDTCSGVAGDMTVAALVDLGVPFAEIEAAVAALGLPGVRLAIQPVHAGAIGALKFDVLVEAEQPERSHREIDAMLEHAPLEPPVADLARRIFRRLAEAEARVHRVPIGDVHFHEVGAVDAIADVVGAAAGFAYLGATVLCTPLPMGRGTVSTRHGEIPLPAPATVECLCGCPTYDAGIDGELVTPTGAAIVATVASGFGRWPSFAPERVGWGAGSRTWPDRPNALRAVLGSATAEGACATGTHAILEATVDDMTGELAAHVIAMLLQAGARDAWAAPITMKKGRPGLTLGALVDAAAADAVTAALLRESTTIGVRRIPVTRTERPRRTIQVPTRFGTIAVKSSEGPYGAPQLKPEFDACARAAAAAGVPVREVIAEALAVARRGS
jgi:pyridinium-3,5-bisthiocarboxylic acid mononucleotide nickel chelatase